MSEAFDGFNPNLFPRARRVTEIMKGWVSTFVMPSEAPLFMSEHYDPLASDVRPVVGWGPATPWTETDGVDLRVNQMTLPEDAA